MMVAAEQVDQASSGLSLREWRQLKGPAAG
jgi:hypothetical protein